MNKTLRAQADELIFTLNAIACKYDQRSFGLPVFEGEAIRDRMINAVLDVIQPRKSSADRDHLAEEAMKRIVQSGVFNSGFTVQPQQIATMAYLIADAMLAAREASHG